MLKTGITVALLSYKEAENLKVLIPQIKEKFDATGEDYEILVIDTQEPLDDTPEVCKEFGCIYKNQEYPGFGGAFRTAIKYANMDKFFILDSDGSHDPKYIPKIYEEFMKGGVDLVIGSRYVKGGQTSDAKSSIIMSHILNFFFRKVIGVSAKDISTDFRMYHTADLKAVELKYKNYDVLEEVLLKIRLNKPNKKLVITEVPISFHKRLYGESKRQLIPFIISYIRSLFELTAMRMRG